MLHFRKHPHDQGANSAALTIEVPRSLGSASLERVRGPEHLRVVWGLCQEALRQPVYSCSCFEKHLVSLPRTPKSTSSLLSEPLGVGPGYETELNRDVMFNIDFFELLSRPTLGETKALGLESTWMEELLEINGAVGIEAT